MCLEPATGATVIVDDEPAVRISDFGTCESTAVLDRYRLVHVGPNYSPRAACFWRRPRHLLSLVNDLAGEKEGLLALSDLFEIVTIS